MCAFWFWILTPLVLGEVAGCSGKARSHQPTNSQGGPFRAARPYPTSLA